MLNHLSIKNYILIRDLEIEFGPGFTAITGETGAGKSILVGAMSLILGKRADTDVLLDKQDKCVIEGVFRLSGPELLPFFKDNDLDFEEQLVLRREINNSGKSRAFINDTPVNLPLMRELGEKLVDIHSQHETLMLNESGFQLALIDSFADNQSMLEEMQKRHYQYITLKARLGELIKKETGLRSEADFIRFQFEELKAAGLKEGELQELEEEQKLLEHAEEIKGSLFNGTQSLYASDDNIIDRLRDILNSLGKVSSYHNDIGELKGRLESVHIEMKDIGQSLERLEEGISYDPARLQEVNDRLDIIHGLLQKHRVNEISGLIGIMMALGDKLSTVEHIDEDLRALEKDVAKADTDMMEVAVALRKRRQKVLPELESQLSSTLTMLGMDKGRVKVNLGELSECAAMGMDMAEFLFSANPGIPPAPVSRIASGGELSRLMLALKSLITKKNLLPTIILDEIDMGVSGEIAGKVGKLLCRMSENIQLIAITHLPQIAGMAGNHFMVYKKSSADRTVSGVKRLSGIERVEEIAGMLSNERITESARAAAKELLNNN